MPSKFKFDSPNEAIAAIAERLATVSSVSLAERLTGRVLSADVVADRDSPAADVSAMDGYAIQLDDLQGERAIPVAGESAPGAPPPELKPGSAVRIFTGAIVPPNAQAVIKREDTEESENEIRLLDPALKAVNGEHIRYAGENAKSGQSVLPAGSRLTAAKLATMANFGCYEASVHAAVRVGVLTSGNEVGLFEDTPPKAWQLRNSNRFSVSSLLDRPGLEIASVQHCVDDADVMTQTLTDQLEVCDAVLLTGGVSMGDYDFVPDVVKKVGGEIIFHGLPVRPGKPILAAATDAGKLILGLPGNPVSATVGCHRFALPLLAKMGGQADWNVPCPVVRLEQAGTKTIPLHWMRLVRLIDNGVAEPIASQGSGDLVSLGKSTGYVELPPNEGGQGPWPYRAW